MGWMATSVFQTPIAPGQRMGRKNLIFRNGDDTDVDNDAGMMTKFGTLINDDCIDDIR